MTKTSNQGPQRLQKTTRTWKKKMHKTCIEQWRSRENRPSATPGAGPSGTRSQIPPPVTQSARRNPQPPSLVTQSARRHPTPPPVSQPMRQRMPPPQYTPPQRQRQSPPLPERDTLSTPRRGNSLTGNPSWDVKIYTNGPNSEWPEPKWAHPKMLAHIPIPATWHGDPRESVTNMPTAQRVADVYEANTYEQLWPLFESGALTIPDTFTRLYLMDRTNNSVHFI